MAKRTKKLLVEFNVMILDDNDRPIKNVSSFAEIVLDSKENRKWLKQFQNIYQLLDLEDCYTNL